MQKAQNPQVLDYAIRLMDDHAQYNKQLMQLARQKGVEVPVALDREGKSKLERLMGLQGTAFDRQYAQEQAKANQSDVDDLQSASKKVKDADVQAFIAQFLPVQQQHLQLATALQSGGNSSSSSSMRTTGK